jgi:hypothetical protein
MIDESVRAELVTALSRSGTGVARSKCGGQKAAIRLRKEKQPRDLSL